jgi:hypothetical protein
MSDSEEEYLCVGICMPDPDSGYCLGCGRPPLPVSLVTQGIVAEEQRPLRFSGEFPDGDSPKKPDASR